MKSIALTIIAIFLAGCAHTAKDPYELLVTESGFVYVGMPKEDLPKAGYTQRAQKGYRKQEDGEWITFANPDAKAAASLVTFHIVNGKVNGWEQQ